MEHKFNRLVDKVSTVGIDFDTKNAEVLQTNMERALRFGTIGVDETKHGYHIKIVLHRAVSMQRAFEIRYYCGDDYHRLCRDMIKAMRGLKTIDVLFDLKVRKEEPIVRLN